MLIFQQHEEASKMLAELCGKPGFLTYAVEETGLNIPETVIESAIAVNEKFPETMLASDYDVTWNTTQYFMGHGVPLK